MNNAKDCCFRCGETGHFINSCPMDSDEGSNDESSSDESSDEDTCFRCGRTGHWRITCTEKTDIDGKRLEPELLGHIGSFIKSLF